MKRGVYYYYGVLLLFIFIIYLYIIYIYYYFYLWCIIIIVYILISYFVIYKDTIQSFQIRVTANTVTRDFYILVILLCIIIEIYSSNTYK